MSLMVAPLLIVPSKPEHAVSATVLSLRFCRLEMRRCHLVIPAIQPLPEPAELPGCVSCAQRSEIDARYAGVPGRGERLGGRAGGVGRGVEGASLGDIVSGRGACLREPSDVDVRPFHDVFESLLKAGTGRRLADMNPIKAGSAHGVYVR